MSAVVPAAIGSGAVTGGLSDRRRSLAFFTLLVALVLEIVDTTIVNTALPAIQRDFGHGGGSAAAQWIVAGYSLTFAMLLILGGRLGDLFGGRAMFIVGVAGFTLASVLCGAAGSAGQLVAARIAQGASGAIMAPQVLALIQVLYDPVERIGRLAWFGVVGGLAAILGPVIGGSLIALDLFGLSWRVVFLINAPVGIAAIIAACAFLPRAEKHPDARIDPLGTVLLGAALLALLFPLVRGGDVSVDGWALASFAAAAVLAVLGWRGLGRRAARGQPVLFDPALLGRGQFRAGLGATLGFSAANTGFLFVFALGLQQVAGFSPLQAGLAHIPFSAGVMLGISVIGRRYLARAGRVLLFGGLAVLALSDAAILAWIAVGAPVPLAMVPVTALAGLGMGMVTGPMGPVVLARIERRDAGAASGLLKTVQQAGSALGVALFGSAYFAFGRGSGGGLHAAIAVSLAVLALSALAVSRLPRDLIPGTDRRKTAP